MTIAELIDNQIKVVDEFQKRIIEQGDMESIKGLEVAINTLQTLKFIENPKIDLQAPASS